MFRIADTLPGMDELRLARVIYEEMASHCLDAYPLEGCGLLAGSLSEGSIDACFPVRNASESSRVYTVDPIDHLRADRSADALGLEIVGVFHSHTHTAAYPSPTDIVQAPDPNWHYLLVSLAGPRPVVRSFRIVEGDVEEEPIILERAIS